MDTTLMGRDGNSIFNMGMATMDRIDSLIRQIAYYNSILYLNGQPLIGIIIELQKQLYVELYAYLTVPEKIEGDRFIAFFEKYRILNTGHSILYVKQTKGIIFRFQLWTMQKLKDKGLLTLMGSNPSFAYNG